MSGTGHGNDRIDALRKLATVAVLVLGVVLLHRYGTGGDELPTTAMLALGFVVLASYTFGELVGVVKLPHITGYLLAGVLLGPSAAGWAGDLISTNIPPPFALDHVYHGKPDGGVLSMAVQDQLAPFSTLAIALIAMTAGGELRIESLKKGFKTLLGVLGGQIAIIVPVMVLFVFAISGQFGEWLAMPFTTPTGSGGMALGGLSFLGVLLIGGVVASISIATSPAATIAVINGTRAKGPMTQSVLSAVVLKDVVVVLLFSILAAVAAVVISPADLQMPSEYVKTAQVDHGDGHGDGHGSTHETVRPDGADGESTDPMAATHDAHAAEGHDAHAADGHDAHAADGHDAHAAGGDGAAKGHEHAAPPTVGAFTATLAWHILGSLAIGLLIGLLVAAYLRFIGVEILLFLVGMVFAVAYVGSAIGLDTTLVFIAAGFAATNFSKEGERLIHEVELLGTPVYVIFFTMTGAHLDLTALISLLPYVIPLVAVRTFAIWFGVRAGTAITGAPEPVKKHAWMGFISQAGVAIALAGLVGGQFGDTGLTLQALIIAGVAVHEVIGPVALKAALGLAHEIPSSAADEHEEQPADEADLPPPERLRSWTPPEDVEDPWGVANKSVSPALDEVQDELRDDLVALVRDVEQGHLAEWAGDARDYLDALRREFLRHHRRVSVAVHDDRGDATLQARAEMAALADRWRDLVLARSAEVATTTWSPMVVSQAVDELADRVPDSIDAAFEPESLRGTDADSAIWGVRRSAFRIAHNAQAAVTGTVPLRRVPVRDVVRYHMSGLLPGRLEGLAALLISGEQHLNQRTRSLFSTVNNAYETLIEAIVLTSARAPEKLLIRIRHRIEEEFALARDEVAAIIEDGALRTARILGQSWRDVVDDLPRAATLDLPRRSRRYSKVFRERARGLATLEGGLQAARKSTAARYDSLALDLEIVRLEGRIRDLVDQHGQALARNVRGKGATQVIRVEGALRDALTAVESILAEEHTASELAASLRATCEPLDHIAEDAARSASQLHEQLSDEHALTPLLDALLVAARDLTDRYTIPVGPERSGDWSLPPPTATTEVPFRDIVRAFVETAVTRKLTELTRTLADGVRELATTLDDFDRLVAFNVELATGELDLVDGPVSDSVRDLVHEMIVGNLTRARGRLESVRDGSEGWAKTAEEGVHEAVLGGLDTLRAQVQEGKVSELRVRLLREAAAGRRLVKRAGGLRGLGNSLGEAIEDIARGTLGTAGVTRAQRALGLPLTAEELR
ncbi:MAG: cation:proton antiporter, partial [Myxococcota bacterium]